MKNLIRLLSVLIFIFSLIGCVMAPTQSLSSNDRSKLTKVRIKSDIEIPPRFLFANPVAATVANGGGLTGALIVAMSTSKSRGDPMGKTDIQKFAEDNGFPVPQIIKDEFVRAAMTKGTIEFSEDFPSSLPVLDLQLVTYGFGARHGLTNTVYPYMRIDANIKDPTGRVMWASSADILAFSSEQEEGHEYSDYMENPELVKKGLVKASSVISRKLVADLYK